jgi:hypothetical protein
VDVDAKAPQVMSVCLYAILKLAVKFEIQVPPLSCVRGHRLRNVVLPRALYAVLGGSLVEENWFTAGRQYERATLRAHSCCYPYDRVHVSRTH